MAGGVELIDGGVYGIRFADVAHMSMVLGPIRRRHDTDANGRLSTHLSWHAQRFFVRRINSLKQQCRVKWDPPAKWPKKRPTFLGRAKDWEKVIEVCKQWRRPSKCDLRCGETLVAHLGC